MPTKTAPSAPASAGEDIAAKLLTGAAVRVPYTLAGDRVPYGHGEIARGVHNSQTDADGLPLALLVYEPRGSKAQMIPLAVVAHAIAAALISPAEIAALQAAAA